MSSILDGILRDYQSATSTWANALFPFAQKLFFILVAIELTWAAIWWVIEREDGGAIVASLLKKVLAVSFFYAILLNANTWIPAVLQSFTIAGAAASGLPDLNPGTVFNQGLGIGANILVPLAVSGLLTAPVATLVGFVSAIVVVIAFAIIAAQLLITLVESYIVIGGGILLLGFAGSRWTKGFAERYLGYAASVGVKLFVLYLIMGVGANIALKWGDLLVAAADNMTPAVYLEIIGGSLVFVLLAWTVPATVSSLMVGIVSLSLADAVMPTTVGVRATAAAAGATAATLAYLGHRATDHWSATRAAQLHTTIWTRGSGPGSNGGVTPPSGPSQGPTPSAPGGSAPPEGAPRPSATSRHDVAGLATEAPAPSSAPGRPSDDRDAGREPPTPSNQPLAL